MAEALWTALVVFIVIVAAQMLGPRMLKWLIDRSLREAEKDPYFNREYARPKKSDKVKP